MFHLESFPGEHLFINIAEGQAIGCIEVLLRDRTEQLLNVADGEQAFIIVDKQKQQDMLLAVFLRSGAGSRRFFA